MKVNENYAGKVTVILKDGEYLNISTNVNENNYVIKCKNNKIYFDDISIIDIENLKNEKKAIKKMRNYLKEKLKKQ